jgi:ribonucleoside-diphosphate reductase alpha chain
MQAAFQKYTDNAVSKTVNLPQNSSPKDVRDAYLVAHRMRSKGVTVYRYGSKSDQVLTIETAEKNPNKKELVADSEFGGGCEGIICPH